MIKRDTNYLKNHYDKMLLDMDLQIKKLKSVINEISQNLDCKPKELKEIKESMYNIAADLRQEFARKIKHIEESTAESSVKSLLTRYV
jgi:cytochrome c-type biogenesis protein CcmH/NrfF